MRLRLLILSLFYLGAAGQQATVKSVVGGAVVPSIGNQTVKPSDATAPSLDSMEVGRVADDSIYLFFSESLNESYTPATTAFSVTGPYGSPAVSAVTVAGDTVIIRLATDAYFGDTVKVSYTRPESNALQDSRGNETASWSADTAINNVSFVAAYQAVYDAYTTKPVDSLARYDNKMVKRLVDSSLWVKFDRFKYYAIHTNNNGEALINWPNPGTGNSTLHGKANPAFTALQGFLGSTTDSCWVGTNFVPSVNGSQYTQNSASFILYIRTNVSSATQTHGTWNNTDGKDMGFIPKYSTNMSYARINDGGSDGAANTNGSGLFVATRTASDVKKLYRNSTAIIEATRTSTGLPTKALYLNAINDDDVAVGFRVDQISMDAEGSGFTLQQVITFTAIIEENMDAKKTGVIP